MKKDQLEAEEVSMKVYLHKISLEKNVFSLRGFSLRSSGNVIALQMRTTLRRLREPHAQAIRSGFEAC